jgi:hypothetical protein
LRSCLELQEPAVSLVLLGKYGVQHPSPSPGLLLHGLLHRFRELDDRVLLRVLAEIVATTGDLRARVNAKCRFIERLHDPTQCLLLDDHIVRETKLVPIDPSIADAAPLEDDLIAALRRCGARALPARRRSSPGSAIRPRHCARRHPTTTRRS